jgi:CRISPR-associated protein Cas1
MPTLADTAFTEPALRRAWTAVLTANRDDGVPSPGVRRFEERLDDELGRLVADLAWGAYEPLPLTEFVLDEPGRERVLHIPAVRDRVVERAVLDAITPVVDPLLGSGSYAYRPGLGVADAVQALARLRDEGLRWVLRADVDNCFPTIPVETARRLLGALVADADLLRVVDLLLARGYRDASGRLRRIRGVAQGCALSPMLANLVLSMVDARVVAAGFPLVRYADDMAVAVDDETDAWEAARVLAAAVEELGMSLGAEDTRAMSFSEGFTFLGEDFGPRYPPVLVDARVEDPGRKVLYAAVQGSRVRVAAGRVIVESSGDETLLDVPQSHVGRVVCFGSVGVSAGARSWAMAGDVDVMFASRRGTYQGVLLAADAPRRAERIRAQVALSGSEKATVLARAIVEAKVRKQIVVLQHFSRRAHVDTVPNAVSAMSNVLLLLPDCGTSAEAMGVEGAAAAAYFPALGALMPEGLTFTHRTRRPPLDVANSALSFLYTVLLGECVSALVAAGLEPVLGIMHADDEGRPSLALDLIEEFRPLVVDQVVLEAARQGRLTAAHGRVDPDKAGVLLTQSGREVLLTAYENRMLRHTRGALPDFAGSLRRHLYRQAQRLQGAISGSGEWSGLSWR